MKILFVCLGNICRSSSAEEVMRTFVKREGLEEKIEVDSEDIPTVETPGKLNGRGKADSDRSKADYGRIGLLLRNINGFGKSGTDSGNRKRRNTNLEHFIH